MEFFKFIQWWWKKLDIFDKVILSQIVGWPILVISFNYFGIIALDVIGGGIVIFILFKLCQVIRNQFNLYKKEKEQEADEIIKTLQGAVKNDI